jgi:hypothetical protein
MRSIDLDKWAKEVIAASELQRKAEGHLITASDARSMRDYWVRKAKEVAGIA